jgi:hypothetical protein
MRQTILLLALLAGCATVPKRPPTEPASLGDWCDQLGNAVCTAMADRCFGGMSGVADGCRQSFPAACLAGRAPTTPSGRTWGDVDNCRTTIRQQSCEGLGATIGSGQFSAQCSATAPQL